MKVLFLGKRLSGHGGMETIVTRVYDFLLKNNINVKFLFLAGGGLIDTSWLGGRERKVLYTRYPRILRNFRYVNLLKGELIRDNVDFVVALDPDSCLIAKKLSKIMKFKVVSWIHFSLNTMKKQQANKIKEADLHWVISKGLMREYSELGIAEESCLFTPNFVKRKEANLLNKDRQELKLLYMGRVQWEGDKYLSDLFNALVKLNRRWSLEIIGSGDDKKICEKFINENTFKYRGSITWYGWVDKPWLKLELEGRKYNYLILPSHSEGFGMVVVEALSYGVPCICSNISPGPADLITEKNGFLFDKGDIDDLVELLQSPRCNREWNEKEVKESIECYYQDSCEETFLKSLYD